MSATYLLLYSGGSMPETEEDQKAVMDAWMAWLGELGDKLVDGGNPFTPMAKTVSPDGAISDGPIGTLATGYSLIKADSLDEAAQLATGCPVKLGGGSISVYETFDVM
jgi:hypothetical protein